MCRARTSYCALCASVAYAACTSSSVTLRALTLKRSTSAISVCRRTASRAVSQGIPCCSSAWRKSASSMFCCRASCSSARCSSSSETASPRVVASDSMSFSSTNSVRPRWSRPARSLSRCCPGACCMTRVSSGPMRSSTSESRMGWPFTIAAMRSLSSARAAAAQRSTVRKTRFIERSLSQQRERRLVDLDPGALAHLLQELPLGLGLLLGERAPGHLFLDLVQGALARPAASEELEQVISVAGLHHAGHLPGPEREGRLVEGLGHGAPREPAQVPATLSVRRAAVRFRQLLEGSAGADLVEQALRLLGRRHQDLLRVHLFPDVQLGVVLLEPRAHLGGGRLLPARLIRDPFFREQAVAHVLRQLLGGLAILGEPVGERLARAARRLRQRVAGGLHLGVGDHHPGCLGALHEQGAVDQRLEQSARQAGQVLGLDLRRGGKPVDHLRPGTPARPIQLALQQGDRDRGPVHHRDRRRGRGGRRLLARAGQEQQRGGGPAPARRQPHQFPPIFAAAGAGGACGVAMGTAGVASALTLASSTSSIETLPPSRSFLTKSSYCLLRRSRAMRPRTVSFDSSKVRLNATVLTCSLTSSTPAGISSGPATSPGFFRSKAALASSAPCVLASSSLLRKRKSPPIGAESASLLSLMAAAWKAFASPFFSRAWMSLSSDDAFVFACAFSLASLAGRKMW